MSHKTINNEACFKTFINGMSNEPIWTLYHWHQNIVMKTTLGH